MSDIVCPGCGIKLSGIQIELLNRKQEYEVEVELLKKELEETYAAQNVMIEQADAKGYQDGLDRGLVEGERRCLERVKEAIKKLELLKREGKLTGEDSIVTADEILLELGFGGEEEK